MPVLSAEEIELENEKYGFCEIDTSKANGKLIMHASQQGNLLKVKVDQKLSNIARLPGSGGTRGRVKGFSKESRKRMLEMFAGLDQKEIMQRGAAFLTLTYGSCWPSPKQAKRHLESLIRRIVRRSECENPCFIWRMEPQERGAPHFHVIILGWKRSKDGWPLTADDFRRMWGEVVGVEYWNYARFDESGDIKDITPPRLEIKMVRKARQVMSYVSKYMAKVSDKSLDPSPGQTKETPDSCPNQVPALQSGADGEAVSPDCETIFINLAYLATNGEIIEFIGRSWGIMFRVNLPFAEKQMITIEFDDRFEGFARHIGWRWAKLRGDVAGFTVFHENAVGWFDILEQYIAHIDGVPF